MGQRKKKGEISVFNDSGIVRLRWRYNSQRCSLSTGFPYKRQYISFSKDLAKIISNDILAGSYDLSLKKYEQEIERYRFPEANNSVPPALTNNQDIPLSLESVKKETQVELPPLKIYLDGADEKPLSAYLDLYKFWVKNIRCVDIENSSHYSDVKWLIEHKWADVYLTSLPEVLNAEGWAPSTFNSRRGCLKKFFTWLIGRNVLAGNPLGEIREKKRKRDLSGRRDPLEKHEIILILQAIRDNTFCHPSSRYPHSHYYPYILFLVLTGVRPSEGIGLRVKHIDFENGTIEISETMARTLRGSHAAARIRKGTKTENLRRLPMSTKLRRLLEKQVLGKMPDDLVFPSYHGKPIDDKMLLRRVIKPILKGLNISERVLYVFRHTFGTKAITEGIVPTGVAYAMGNDVATVFKNYVHKQKPPTSLPDVI